MIRSLNEIDATAKKAARGAGFAWGLAEEAGKSVRWLEEHGLPGCLRLADYLSEFDGLTHAQVSPERIDGIWSAPSGRLCPIATGAGLNDCAHLLAQGRTIEMQNVACPVLVVPFLRSVARQLGQPVRLSFGAADVICDDQGCSTAGLAELTDRMTAEGMKCSVSDKPVPVLHGPHRTTIADVIWDRLNAFAHRTYAPATEESRQRGAGAGVTDND